MKYLNSYNENNTPKLDLELIEDILQPLKDKLFGIFMKPTDHGGVEVRVNCGHFSAKPFHFTITEIQDELIHLIEAMKEEGCHIDLYFSSAYSGILRSKFYWRPNSQKFVDSKIQTMDKNFPRMVYVDVVIQPIKQSIN